MRILSIVLASFLVWSCGSTKPEDQNKNSDSANAVTTVVQINQEVTVSVGEASYRLFVPDTATTRLNGAVILLDPSGKGDEALLRYKEIATRNGWLLAGSLSTRNGMDQGRSFDLVGAMVKDLQQKYGARTPVYLVGFSGGARVAAFCAARMNDVSGVVCAGAAPAGVVSKPCVLIAGLADMNYREAVRYKDEVGKKNQNVPMLVTAGKHEWPDVAAVEAALLVLNSGAPEHLQTITDSIAAVSCYWAEQWCRDLSLSSNKSIADYYQSRLSSYSIACADKDHKELESLALKEDALQKELSEAVLMRDTTWWRANGKNYFEPAGTSLHEQLMRRRLRGYVSLTCYTYATQSFKMTNMRATEKLVKVYSIVDPTNPEWAYMQARLFIMLSLNEEAMKSLQLLPELGFRDITRLGGDETFTALRTDQRFKDVMAACK
jgi:pimeloyl-ACP methyl ester carboxylesterase